MPRWKRCESTRTATSTSNGLTAAAGSAGDGPDCVRQMSAQARCTWMRPCPWPNTSTPGTAAAECSNVRLTRMADSRGAPGNACLYALSSRVTQPAALGELMDVPFISWCLARVQFGTLMPRWRA